MRGHLTLRPGSIGAYFLKRDARDFARELVKGDEAWREKLEVLLQARILVFCRRGLRYDRARFDALLAAYARGGTGAVLALLPPREVAVSAPRGRKRLRSGGSTKRAELRVEVEREAYAMLKASLGPP